MILEEVISHALAQPHAVAVVDDKRTVTYRELIYGAALMRGHLQTLAPVAECGPMVGLLIPPSAAFTLSFAAARWDQRLAIPMNYLLKAEELAAIIRDADLRFILTIEHFRPLAEQINAGLTAGGGKAVRFVYMETLEFPKPGLAVMASIAADPANLAKHLPPVPPRLPDDTAVILYTSGTSGTPKGVMLTNRNLESNAMDSVKHCRFTQKTVFLGVLPMFHSLGLQANCLIPMMLGCKVVYQARFSPVGIFEAVAKHGCEVLIAVPTMFSVLAAAKSAKRESLASLKYAISGGEALPVPLQEAFQEKFGLMIHEGFGLTETSPIVAISLPWAHKTGSVGQVIPEVEVKMVSEEGKTQGVNQDGELWVKGPNVMKGYYQKPEMTAEVLVKDEEGGIWFKTGDIARLDEEGYLFITGRKKDMIIMAGEKVFPREIEEAMKQHPALLHVAVIGVKDGARGEMPVAFVQLKPDLPAEQKPSANDLRAFVRERIAPYKTPREVYFMDCLPVSATGKILKRELVIPKTVDS